MPGFCDDITSDMVAADMLIHPSLTEASNNVVKEMSYWGKPVAVCKGVGDFDDYKKDDINRYRWAERSQKVSLKNFKESICKPGTTK